MFRVALEGAAQFQHIRKQNYCETATSRKHGR